MASPLRVSLLLTCTLGLGLASLAACSSEEPATVDEEDGGETGGGGRRSSSSSSGDGNGSSSSSSSSGAASSSGGSSSSSSGSSSGGDVCEDPEDDVGDMTAPKLLPDTDDGVETITTIDGFLSDGDEDAYRVFVKDVGGAKVLPDASTRSLTSNLCLFIECSKSGETVDVDCETGTKTTFSPKIQGCCIQGQGRITMDYSGCSWAGTGNDSLNAYFRIQNPTQACVEYNIDYQF